MAKWYGPVFPYTTFGAKHTFWTRNHADNWQYTTTEFSMGCLQTGFPDTYDNTFDFFQG